MRINWFSPLPPQRTDIAHYTARIAAALMDEFDVEFWTDLKADASSLPPGAKIRRFDPAMLDDRDLRREMFDALNIYNLGNDAQFHRGIGMAALRTPGLVVLHDSRLHHFAFECSRADGDDFASYRRAMGDLYGEAGATCAAEIVASNGRLIDQHVDRYPMCEPYLDQALGVLCHSRAAAEEARRLMDAPTLTLPLPFRSMAGETAPTAMPPGPPWRFVLFGYINPNRRLLQILDALAAWRGPPFRLDVYGSLWDEGLVRDRIRALGLVERVALHGFASEEVLDAAISQAHLAFNLRHPTMGEASGGILRAWALGVPAVVTRGGWYADLPDAIAAKIAPEQEAEELGALLKDLVTRPEYYSAMGRAAREWVEKEHSPETYARQLRVALANRDALFNRFAQRLAMRSLAAAIPDREARRVYLDQAADAVSSAFGTRLHQ